jgi:hypothetical protein
MRAMHFLHGVSKLPNLELKTRPIQLLGYLLLAFSVLPTTKFVFENIYALKLMK